MKIPLDVCATAAQSHGMEAKRRLYDLAHALLSLEQTVDVVALGAAVDAALVSAALAESALRRVAAEHPAHHDDLARLAALVRGGAISPAAAERAAAWVGSL